MTPEEAIEIAIHCLSVQAEQEVCEECDIYGNCHTDCKDIARLAIKALKEIQQHREIGTVEECKGLASIVNMAEKEELAKIIDEWLLYSKIGTVEECREAVEKQKQMKPEIYTDTVQTINESFQRDVFECPVCGNYICNVEDEIPGYCCSCGQKLEEREEE